MTIPKPLLMLAIALVAMSAGAQPILNVSYHTTRELHQDFNAAFAAQWQARACKSIVVQQSHGGSGKQAPAVLDGLTSDVTTLALAYDVDAIAQAGLIAAGWQKKLPYSACPYTSMEKHTPSHLPRFWCEIARQNV